MTNTTAPDEARAMTAPTYANLLDRIVEKGGYALPDGTDMWTIRSVHPDLRSSRGYRWPFPGQWAEAPGPLFETNADPCPASVGDGLCVATTWKGMASGGIPAIALLLCAITADDALSPVDADKIRVRRTYVVDVIDGASAVREHGANTYLYGALLYGADLYGAALAGANLNEANLSRSDLSGSDLYGANLYGVNFYGANLYGTNLSGSDLVGANLARTNLDRANLIGANLTGANFDGANLHMVRWDESTTWPRGFNPKEATK